MKKSCIYDRDKIVIYDENKNYLKELIISRNIIGKLSNKQVEIEEKLANLKKIKKPNKKKYIKEAITSIFGYELVVILAIIAFTMSEINEEYLLFEGFYYAAMLGMIAIPIIATKYFYDRYSHHKEIYVEKEANEMQLFSINKLLTKEKERISDLLNNNREKINNVEVIKINDLDELKRLRKILKEIKNVSHNKDKLGKYYKKDLLEDEMNGNYELETIQMTKDYFDSSKKLIKSK